MGRRRITLDVDEDVLAAMDRAAGDRGESRNRLITTAIERVLKEIERRRIDAEFEQMADDPEYLGLLRRMEAESRPATDRIWQGIEPAETQEEAANATG